MGYGQPSSVGGIDDKEIEERPRAMAECGWSPKSWMMVILGKSWATGDLTFLVCEVLWDHMGTVIHECTWETSEAPPWLSLLLVCEMWASWGVSHCCPPPSQCRDLPGQDLRSCPRQSEAGREKALEGL